MREDGRGYAVTDRPPPPIGIVASDSPVYPDATLSTLLLLLLLVLVLLVLLLLVLLPARAPREADYRTR